MTKWGFAVAMLGLGLMLGLGGQASADTCTTFDSTNGTTTFPGTYVGVVSGSCQIGNLSDPNQGNALVNSTNNPSIYEFQLASDASVTIQDELGNNGIGNAVDAELFSLAGSGSTSPSGSALASIQIPYTSGPSGEYPLFSGDLTAGYYAIDTYLALGGTVDPRYQVNITAVTATPEPSSLLMLGMGLAGLAFFRRREAVV